MRQSITINGRTFNSGDTFQTRSAVTWYGSADGGNGTGTIPKGYSVTFVGDYSDEYSWATFPYLISGLGSLPDASNQEWTGSNVFPPQSYTVSYNSNGSGVSNMPTSQTKYYGENLTLSTKVPVRSGYTFKGWATSSGGSVAYSAGGTYKLNSAVTLYAVWAAGYVDSFEVSAMYTDSYLTKVVWTPQKASQWFRIRVEYDASHYVVSGWIHPNTTSKYTFSTQASPNVKIPQSWVSYIGTAGYITPDVYLYTYEEEGGSSTGRSKVNTAKLYPKIYDIGISATLSEGLTSTVFGNSTWLVQNYSKLKVQCSGTPESGTTITKFTVKFNSISHTVNASNNSATITFPTEEVTSYGNKSVYITAYDSVGRSTTDKTTYKIPVYQYFNPSVSSAVCNFNDSSGHNIITYDYSVASVHSANGYKVKISRKDGSSSTYTQKYIDSSWQTSSFSGRRNWEDTTSDEISQYEYKIEIQDRLGWGTEVVIPSAAIALSFKRGGQAAMFFSDAGRMSDGWVGVKRPTGSVGFMAMRSDNERGVGLAVGTGGSNMGIYNDETNSWEFLINSNNNVFISNWASIGGTFDPVYFNSSGRPVAVSTTTTSGVWKCKVWADGRKEVWCQQTIASAVNTTQGSLYRTDPAVYYTYPSSFFSATPNIEVNIRQSNSIAGWLGFGGSGDSTRTPNIYFYSPTSRSSSANIYINIHAWTD